LLPGIHPLWAVHIADGVLTPLWLAGGFLGMAVLAVWGARRLQEEEIPQIALLTAAFFVASAIHVRVGPTTAHLLLNGLLGVLLGRRAVLAILVGIFLQAILFQHGGLSAIGINSCVMILPALLAAQLFAGLNRLPLIDRGRGRAALVAISILVWLLSLACGLALMFVPDIGQIPAGMYVLFLGAALGVSWLMVGLERRLENAPEFPIGLLVGEVAVLATIALNCVVLLGSGQQLQGGTEVLALAEKIGLPPPALNGAPSQGPWRLLVLIVFLVHLPIAAIEGIILGFTVGFLARVKPSLLGLPTPSSQLPVPPRSPGQFQYQRTDQGELTGKISSSGTSH
jgi:cobalt/nickel transport system permease protein